MEDARRIVELCTPKAYVVAFRLTGNSQDAWDLVQNAMLRVLRSYSTYDPTYSLDQWLYGILRNLYIDRLRQESRRREDPLDEAAQEGRPAFADTLVDPSPGPDQMLDRQEDRETVQSALSALPLELRMAVTLVDLEGYSYEEAARILESPVSTLGVWVFRGRKMLRENLKPWMEA